jgi:DeoR/GlpR family transcriptional regulator of sugar metabolism
VSRSLADERRNKIAQMIVAEGSVKIGRLAEMFDVSTETIRKDLIYLEEKGIVKKGHGGAIASNELTERPFSIKAFENVHLKSKIAQKAIELINENSIIILDPGSTTLSIAKMLNLKENLTIVTNSLKIAETLSATNNKIFTTGGELRPISFAMVGNWAIQSINSIRADIAFLGTDGFLGRSGPCTGSYEEVSVKQAILKNCKTSIVVCDSSKFTREGIFQYASWNEVDFVITDSGVSKELLSDLKTKTNVIIA